MGIIARNPEFRRHSVGSLTLTGGSKRIEAADYTQLPADAHDLEADQNTTEVLPLDLLVEPRFFDCPREPNTGNPPGQDPLDLGAYRKP